MRPFERRHKMNSPDMSDLAPIGEESKARYHCLAASGKQMAVLSDGAVVCSCWDKGADRVLGNVNDKPLQAIWQDTPYQQLITDIGDGRFPTQWCKQCDFLAEGAPQQPRRNFPAKLLVEYNANCQLKCPGCERDMILGGRAIHRMTPAMVDKLIDEIGKLKSLEKIGFYNHGEPLVYKDGIDMIKRMKQAAPDISIFTSTNGLTLAKENHCRDLIASGIDTVMFSIDGVTQESYGKYRVGGNLCDALSGMEKILSLRAQSGSRAPRVIWRYIIFKWNDSEVELNEAERLSKQLGVDELVFLPATYPADAVSKRFHGSHGDARLTHHKEANVF